MSTAFSHHATAVSADVFPGTWPEHDSSTASISESKHDTPEPWEEHWSAWFQRSRGWHRYRTDPVISSASGTSHSTLPTIVGSDCTAFDNTITEDLWQKRFDELARRIVDTLATHLAYKVRITALCAETEADDAAPSIESQEDFWHFVKSEPLMRKAQIVLLPNGNLRAIWKDGSDKHFGLQFLGRQMAQYVIFTKRPDAAVVSRVAGRDSLQAVKRKIIQAYDLKGLLGT